MVIGLLWANALHEGLGQHALCTSSVGSAITMSDTLTLSYAGIQQIVLVDTLGFEGGSLMDLEVLGSRSALPLAQ